MGRLREAMERGRPLQPVRHDHQRRDRLAGWRGGPSRLGSPSSTVETVSHASIRKMPRKNSSSWSDIVSLARPPFPARPAALARVTP